MTRSILLLAALLAPVAVRTLLQVERAGAVATGDVRGLVADVGAAACVAALWVALGRVHPAVAALSSVVWVGIHFIHYETVLFLGSMADMRDAVYLADPTFVAGSAVAVSRPIAAGIVLIATAWLVWRGSRRAPWRDALSYGVVAVLALGTQALLPRPPELDAWRYDNVVQWNLARLGSSLLGSSREVDSASVADPDVRDALAGLRADLSGEPRVAFPNSRVNVLLVVLESVSGGLLESMSGDQGRTPRRTAPGLDAIARDHLRFSSFVSQQRKTNRGLYALLCGDLPGLAPGEPKMSTYRGREDGRCLPDRLRAAGYVTHFRQAAPLAFMLKEPFMRRAGFSHVEGHESFDRHYARSAWGIDDRAFFEQSLDTVRALQQAGEPWFLTLLNVGTHHPFVVPDDWQPESADPWQRAVSYLDAAFSAFYSELELLGVFEDTLIVITSDESLGEVGAIVGPFDRAISQSWGLAVVRTPAGDGPLAVSETYAQHDVSLSILDYLGLAREGDDLPLGRSLFRHYSQPRWLFFANVNLHAAGAIAPDGDVLLCLDDYASCHRYDAAEGRSFGDERVAKEWDARDERLLRGIAAAHDAAPLTRDREIEIFGSPRYEIRGAGVHVVTGGQYVDVLPGEWVEVELDIAVTGGPGMLQISHFLKRDGEPADVSIVQRMRPGRVLRIAYTLRSESPLLGLSHQVRAKTLEGERFSLDLENAAFRIRSSGTSPKLGLQLERADVESAPAVPRD